MRDTIELAREAGWDDHHAKFDTRLDRLVALVRADEREACAQTCDNLPIPDDFSESEGSVWDVASLDCAAAIRARGDT